MAGSDHLTRPAAWRGLSSEADPASENEGGSGRILLLVEDEGNRRQLAEQLARTYEVLDSANNSLPADRFDLVIVDQNGFRRWHQQIANAKSAEQPVFLPAMLMLPRQELLKKSSAYWDIADELIVAPINRAEFLERVALLLRTRRMALAQQDELAYIVNHDRSTGLPNQTLFMDRLQRAIHEATITSRKLYVVVVRTPFDQLTKSLGGDALERAVQACTSRLRRALGEDLSLARLTTEHWGVLCAPGTSIDEVLAICRRIGESADEPVAVSKEKIHLSTYLGIGTYPDDASTASELVNVAYGALSQASRPGEPNFYSRQVQNTALRYLRTEAQLHDALAKDQFELWFQPQFRLTDAACVGAEALIRWRLPGGDLVSPGDFIPVAESSGLITRIDRWVLENVCHQLVRWGAGNGFALRIAVNVTPETISQDDFVPWLKELIRRADIPAAVLELELTETMFCKVDQTTLDKLQELREFGILVAIDDFGTGYSSLGYLHQLPIGVLKIDKSFTERVPGDSASEGITEAIIGLAHHFDLEIVAEGIETEDQLEYLKHHRVHTGQGFLMARPMPAAEFIDSLKTDTAALPDPTCTRRSGRKT